MAPHDIYTRELIATDSAEHILPNFLGGKLKQRGLLDKATNDRLGSEVDAPLSKAVQSLLLLVDGRSDRGRRPPPDLRGVQGGDGDTYDLRARGILKPSIGERRFERVGDQVRIEGTFQDMEDAERFVRRRAKKVGIDPRGILAQLPTIAEDSIAPSPRIWLTLDLCNESCYRAITKIACNLLARHRAELFLRPDFDDIRRFVNLGTGAPSVEPIVLPIFEGGLGPTDHLVVVRVPRDGEALGLVVLFGALSFVVRLGRVMAERPGTFSYRVNQVRLGSIEPSGRENHPDDLALALPSFDLLAGRSHGEVEGVVRSNAETTLDAVFAVQGRHFDEGLVRSSWERAVEITKPHVNESQRDYAWRLSGEFARLLTNELRLEARMATIGRFREDAEERKAEPDDGE